jgi:hypothetical protein
MRNIIIIGLFTASFISCVQKEKKVESIRLYGQTELYEIIDTLIRSEDANTNVVVQELGKLFKKKSSVGFGVVGNVVTDPPPPPLPPGIENYFERDFFETLYKEKLIDSIDVDYLFNQVDSSHVFGLDSTKVKCILVKDSIIRTYFDKEKGKNGYEQLYEKYRAHSFVRFSTPLISADRTKVIININYHCGGLCGHGSTLLLKKINRKWKIIYTKTTWVS